VSTGSSRARPLEAGFEVLRLPGLTAYAEALHLQEARRDAVECGHAPNTLYLLEHTPTITLGRSTRREHLLRTPGQLAELGIDVCEANRGGDVTYHGPGQLVAYPILDLRRWRTSIRWYLRTLEDVLMRQLSGYGLQAERLEGFTGVWVHGAKVAAVGVALHNWVTSHGVALNVNPDMAHYRCIVPCGIADRPVTSLQRLLQSPPDMVRLMDDFTHVFLDRFGEAGGDGR